MSLLLVIHGPDGQIAECNLATAALPVTLGRKGGSADIEIDDSQMSRRHCSVEADDEAFVLRDLGSSNGTWVNGAEREEAYLQPGDMINVGGSNIEVKRLLDKQDDPLIGQQLGQFLIQAVIGRGSQATVFRGTQVNLDRPVALKIMRNADAQNDNQIKMFIKEAREAGRLNHPHVVQAHDVFEQGDLHVLVMELMEGHSTMHQLQHEGPLPYELAVTILQHIGDALNYAEANHLVHRDVKPANMLSTQNGIYKLADLGIATRMRKGFDGDGRMHGTPLYMSPEQAMGGKVDTRTDIYGLGASIWHLITGSPVFAGNPREVIGAHMHRSVPDLKELIPDCNPGLRELIMAMLSKDPADRPRNGQEIIDRAAAFVGSAEVVGVGSSTAGGRRRRTRRSGTARRGGSTRRRGRRRRR